MTIRRGNPFANRAEEGQLTAAERYHLSDEPGRDYPPADDLERHPSSGTSSPSEPRRPGTNERQAPRRAFSADADEPTAMVPGEIFLAAGDVVINAGMEVTALRVENTADRPIQVGSHYHFAEVNAALAFDREAAWGKRLNVLSGGSARFEPGATEEVELVPIRGARIVPGLRGLCGGSLDG